MLEPDIGWECTPEDAHQPLGGNAMGLFDFAREKLTAVTDVLPTDVVDQALSVGESLTGTDLSGVADAVGQGQGVQDIAVDAASGAIEGTAAEPIVTALGDAQP